VGGRSELAHMARSYFSEVLGRSPRPALMPGRPVSTLWKAARLRQLGAETPTPLAAESATRGVPAPPMPYTGAVAREGPTVAQERPGMETALAASSPVLQRPRSVARVAPPGVARKSPPPAAPPLEITPAPPVSGPGAEAARASRRRPARKSDVASMVPGSSPTAAMVQAESASPVKPSSAPNAPDDGSDSPPAVQPMEAPSVLRSAPRPAAAPMSNGVAGSGAGSPDPPAGPPELTPAFVHDGAVRGAHAALNQPSRGAARILHPVGHPASRESPRAPESLPSSAVHVGRIDVQIMPPPVAPRRVPNGGRLAHGYALRLSPPRL